MRPIRTAASAALLTVLAALVAGCGGGGGDESAPSYSVPHLKLSDLHPCRHVKHPTRMRCGNIRLPFERQDLSLGQDQVAFAVRPRDETSRPSRGGDLRRRGWPRIRQLADGGQLQEAVRPAPEATGAGDRRHARYRGLGCARLPRPAARERPGLDRVPQLRPQARPRFGSYRTSAAADDINDVRRALGYGKITLYGDSYGTFLSQSYAYRHPDTLNAPSWTRRIRCRARAPGTRASSRPGSARCRSPAGARRSALAAPGSDSRSWCTSSGTRTGASGPLVDALGGAGYNPPATYLRIDRAGTDLRHGHSLPWKRLIAEAKLGHGHVEHYSAMDEEVVSCNDYPLLWPKDASEAQRRTDLEHAARATQPGAEAVLVDRRRRSPRPRSTSTASRRRARRPCTSHRCRRGRSPPRRRCWWSPASSTTSRLPTRAR